MSLNATLKNLTLAGFQVTPSDQWTLALSKYITESERNPNGVLTRSKKPVSSLTSGPIRTPSNEVLTAISDTVGWELKADLFDGRTYVMTNCAVENEVQLETDGGVTPLEISGDGDMI